MGSKRKIQKVRMARSELLRCVMQTKVVCKLTGKGLRMTHLTFIE